MEINSQFRSPNFSERLGSIKYVILHYTEMKPVAALFQQNTREERL
jgi:hypothetical protein